MGAILATMRGNLRCRLSVEKWQQALPTHNRDVRIYGDTVWSNEMVDRLTNQKSLAERFAEYLAAPKDNLRAKLIEAVSHHEGWEESAISMVDEAIMPVLQATMQREERLRKALQEIAGQTLHNTNNRYEILVAKEALDQNEVRSPSEDNVK